MKQLRLTIFHSLSLPYSTMDLTMQQMFNTRERTETDWKKLVAQADSRFEWVCVHRPPGSALGIIEIAWSGDQEKDA